jgi:hypothetical protein
MFLLSLVSGRTNTVFYNGKTYSTLGDVAITSYSPLFCQSSAIALPSGWTIAPDNADTIKLSQLNPWSTQVIVVSSGVGYRTLTFPPAGVAYGDYQSKYAQSAAGYYCTSCNSEIMIVYSGTDCSAGMKLILR